MRTAAAYVRRGGTKVWRRIRRVEVELHFHVVQKRARSRLGRQIKAACKKLDEVDAIARGVRSNWTDTHFEARWVCDSTEEARKHLGKLDRIGTGWRPFTD